MSISVHVLLHIFPPKEKKKKDKKIKIRKKAYCESDHYQLVFNEEEINKCRNKYFIEQK